MDLTHENKALPNTITVILPFPLQTNIARLQLVIIVRSGINFKSSELMKSEIVF